MPKDFILCALFGEHFCFRIVIVGDTTLNFFDDYYVNNSSMIISFCTKL